MFLGDGMKRFVFTLLALVLLSLPAMANTDYNVCFSYLDADGDGSMTKSEFASTFSDGDMTVFEAADGDNDGMVSHEEWEEYKASQGFEEGEHHG